MERTYFSHEIAEKIRREIEESYENEVLFFGWIDENGLVSKIEVIARGNEECVSFPIQRSYLPDVVIHNHPDGPLTPSTADMSIASYIAQHGVAFFIINNDLSDVYVAVEPVTRKKITPLSVEQCTSYISTGSKLSGEIPEFEERVGQKEMVAHVCTAFNQDEIAFIEAGTGIGKSIAYLIPSIEWALVNRERVIISTNTINLQEQLLHKDIPDLQRALGLTFFYTLMKGRGNYICLTRLEEASRNLFSFIEDEEVNQFQKIREWAQFTNDGSLSDLPFIPKMSLWEKINSQTELCLGGRCRYFSQCFVNRIKREALRAHIVVTNHHYLLADASVANTGKSVLPKHERIIIDEAHRLEDAATSFFTRRITQREVSSILRRIYVREPRGERGWLSWALREKAVLKGELTEKIKKHIQILSQQTKNFFSVLDEFLSRMNNEFAIINGSTGNNGRVGYPLIEVNKEVMDQSLWREVVLPVFKGFHGEITELSNLLMTLREENKIEQYLFWKPSLKQLDGFIARITELRETVDIFLKENDNTWVRWIEKKKSTAVVIALREVGEELQQLVFSRAKTIILTSATLTVHKKFDFIKSRLGITRPAIEVSVSSPFDYQHQMAIIVPNDAANPQRGDYEKKLSMHVMNIIRETGGKAFILFTAYRTMNRVFETVASFLSKDGVLLLKQGMNTRHKLLDTFRDNVRSVLFGTESFWEGVDVPGESLQCVVITRLPFRVPSNPVIHARAALIEARGGNSFLEYLIPLAAIKLKQGIGRLIRRKTDRGIVVILDERIRTKNYGEIFFQSLPEGKLFTMTLEESIKSALTYIGNNFLTK